MASQSTTTNRTAITTTKLLRTYNTYGQGKFQCVIDLICTYIHIQISNITSSNSSLALVEQKKLNGWDQLRKEEYNKIADNFTVNLDESCMMASDGTVKVVANTNKKKTEKNKDDCRDSVTVVRVGSAANVGGPRIYLAKGKELISRSLSDMVNNLDAPPGSCVIMTPNA